MNSQISQLVCEIKNRGYVTYDEVSKMAFDIAENWREGTWRRELRKYKDIEAIKKEPDKFNSPIVAYETKKEQAKLL